jgi:hypothetical protein
VTLTVRAYEQPLGFFIVFDDSRLQDVLAHPDAYDLGWLLQDRLSISDQRAEAINGGAALSGAELDALKAELMDRQLQSDEGISCAGFAVSAGEGGTVFVAFTGPSEGQGGIRYEFAALFKSRDHAVGHFRSMGDEWFDL